MNVRILCALSLALNLALIGLVFASRRGVELSHSQPIIREPATENRPTNAVGATALTPSRFNWESVESASYQQYIANLRAVGCPEETIRDIVRADVIKLFAEKRKLVLRTAPPFDFMKGDAFLREEGRDAWMQILALNTGRDQTLRALGIEPDQGLKNAKNAAALDWMLNFLGEEKKAEVLRIRRNLDDRLALREPGMEPGAFQQLIDEAQRSIKQVLTADEALRYDLLFSVQAGQLRNELRAFEPTSDEFVTLFKLRHDFEEQQKTLQPLADRAAERARRQSAQEELNNRLLASLTSDRRADYQLAHDPAFAALHGVGKEAGLSNEVIKEAHRARSVTWEQYKQIEAGQRMTESERRSAINALRSQNAERMQTILGPKASSNWQGRWREPWDPVSSQSQ